MAEGASLCVIRGERASVPHVRKALEIMGPGKLINCYGPTEGTVFATAHVVHDIPDSLSSLPIGKPISNASVYILNGQNQLQPFGAVGELCISGMGVSKGI